MDHATKFYIDGQWVDPATPNVQDVVDPSTEQPFARIAVGSAADVDRAVAAARRAFPAYAKVSVADRIALFERALEISRRREAEISGIITREMGAPVRFSTEAQTGTCIAHLETTIAVLRDYAFVEMVGSTAILKEPIGVAGLITPWNWPLAQAVCKVLPALAAGCTMVLKPSELAPLDAIIFAEILDEAGFPPGVFNLVNGDGPTVGEAIARHPLIDMVSFTGSTRAGVQVAKAAADTVKRVTQELGGKSANIILDDADLEAAVKDGVAGCFSNTGQSCDAGSRMFVPRARYDEAVRIAARQAKATRVGKPSDPDTEIGPLASKAQFDKVQRLIQAGVNEGATVAAGGPGRPEGLDIGYYARPTVFSDVTPSMTVYREEIFGPVICIVPYGDEQEAIEMANDTPYGLVAYVQSADVARARRVAAELRVGSVFINYPAWDPMAPFGGYKQSGNGREAGTYAIGEFLEIKSIVGHG